MTVSEQELKDILDKHGKWLGNEEGGERANLSSADLRSADLSSADLRSADLRSADLSSANLRYADLSSANLRSADLRSADLRYANLRSANLRSADLSYANLSSADLRSANPSSADLRSANLRSTKEDFFKVLSEAKQEVAGLYDALLRGKIDGSTYTGECACLVGTIANVRRVDVGTLIKNSDREAERWFLAIRKGDVPRSNAVSKITKGWIEEFCEANALVLPKYKLVSSDQFPEVFK